MSFDGILSITLFYAEHLEIDFILIFFFFLNNKIIDVYFSLVDSNDSFLVAEEDYSVLKYTKVFPI